jgi:transposase InsO family protein
MQRQEFIEMARKAGVNVRELCRRFRISPTTGYKWLGRHEREGEEGLVDRSRRPKRSPQQTCGSMEGLIVEAHELYPSWGPRKLRRLLQNAGQTNLPSVPTIGAVLRRHGCHVQSDALGQSVYQSFCHERPNDLWQMDFKGHFAVRGGRCHPLTVIDDHSRYALCLQACSSPNGEQVRPALEEVFRRFGMPERILCDNGAPWGASDSLGGFTSFGVWLLRLGVDLTHGRPYHPQTQGKCERFHRTLKVEVLNQSTPWKDLVHCQSRFDEWRQRYNHVRPHQALNLNTPASLYRPSQRSLPKALPPIEYLPEDIVRTVKSKGEITFKNRFFFIGQPFCGLPVALRSTLADGHFEVFFSWKKLGSLNLRSPLKPKYLYNPLDP